jgi:predicted amidophosphoribosyltransferase
MNESKNKCHNCGKELKENIQSFCPKCDNKLSFDEKMSLLWRDLENTISSLHIF